jgi:hypothetical protein
MAAVQNKFLANNLPTWLQTPAIVDAYIWCEIGGEVVAGSKTVADVTTPAKTGDSIVDISDWLSAWFLAATGDAPVGTPFIDTPSVFSNGWGVAGMQDDPFARPDQVVIWAGPDYDFGTLNLPAETTINTRRLWYIKFATTASATDVSPAYNALTEYFNTEAGSANLLVQELKSIE